jgi:sugar (pentulose or hexulose) kinase
MSVNYCVGIDFGTSGARAIAIPNQHEIHAEVSLPFPPFPDFSPAELWKTTLIQLLHQLPVECRRNLRHIAINGTSGTVLLCDRSGQPVTDPLLYSDSRAAGVMDDLRAIAPADHPVLSASSSLAKVLWWSTQPNLQTQIQQEPLYLLHQADWLSFHLHGQLGISDYHNALKLGYDVAALRYPDWMAQLPDITRQIQLPQVVTPGTVIGTIQGAIATDLEIPATCQIHAGTTDSIAAFLASGAHSPGEAVTSLGSTLVLKLLSQTRLDRAKEGIYSHRFGNHWLVGGASNTGGAVLAAFFSTQDLQHLSSHINPLMESSLHYYPLLKPGERFPINNATLEPQLTPRPDNPVEFLHGLLESIARIEAQGYQRLQELGATPLRHVFTAGGGAQNPTWTKIRDRHLRVPVQPSQQTEAAYGTALLALLGTNALHTSTDHSNS